MVFGLHIHKDNKYWTSTLLTLFLSYSLINVFIMIITVKSPLFWLRLSGTHWTGSSVSIPHHPFLNLGPLHLGLQLRLCRWTERNQKVLGTCSRRAWNTLPVTLTSNNNTSSCSNRQMQHRKWTSSFFWSLTFRLQLKDQFFPKNFLRKPSKTGWLLLFLEFCRRSISRKNLSIDLLTFKRSIKVV